MCANRGKIIAFVLLVCLLFGMLPAIGSQNSGIGLSLHGGILNFKGDISPDDNGKLGEVSVEVPLSRNFSALVVSGFAQQNIGPSNAVFSTKLLTFDVCGAFKLPVTSFIWPMAYIGVSAINFQRGDFPRYWDGAGIAGVGFELKFSKRLSLGLAADYRYTSGDDFDGMAEGSPDPYMTAKAGIHYHFLGKEKQQEQPLAADVIKSAQKQKTEEEFINELLGANEKSAAETTAPAESSSVPETDIKARIKQLKELIETREHVIAQMKADLQVTDQKIASLEMELRGKGTVTQVLDQDVDFQSQYQFGIQKFNDKVFNEAASIFKALIETDPTHKLASNCQYWIGECEYASKNFDRAIEAFERTLQYANSPKADDAMIMLGLAYKRTAHEEMARQYFERLLAEYPDSEYVALASKYLGLN